MSNLQAPLFHGGRLQRNRDLSTKHFRKAPCPLYAHAEETLAESVQTLDLPRACVCRILIYGARTRLLYEACRKLYPDAFIVLADPVSSALPHQTRATVCNQEYLPFAHRAFDIIVSCLTLQAAENPLRALEASYHCLREGGVFLAQMLGGESFHELRDAFLHAEVKATGGAHQRIAPQIHLTSALTLTHKSGFTAPIADKERLTFSFKTLSSLRYFITKLGWQAPMRDVPFVGKRVYHALQKSLPSPTLTLEIISLMAWRNHAHYPDLHLKGTE